MASETIVNSAWECTWLPPPLVAVLLITPAAKGKSVCLYVVAGATCTHGICIYCTHSSIHSHALMHTHTHTHTHARTLTHTRTHTHTTNYWLSLALWLPPPVQASPQCSASLQHERISNLLRCDVRTNRSVHIQHILVALCSQPQSR